MPYTSPLQFATMPLEQLEDSSKTASARHTTLSINLVLNFLWDSSYLVTTSLCRSAQPHSECPKGMQVCLPTIAQTEGTATSYDMWCMVTNTIYLALATLGATLGHDLGGSPA